jgi:cell division ATPase FtsA
MRLFSSRRTSDTQIAVIIDIGSASIGAALVRYAPDAQPEILYAVRRSITFKHHGNFEQYLRSMRSTLFNVVLKLQEEALSNTNGSQSLSMADIDSVMCVFSSLWCETEHYTVQHSEDDSFTVEQTFLEERLAEDEEELKTAFRTSHDTEATIVDRTFIHTALNGYSTANPYGRQAHRVEATALVTLMYTPVYEQVRETIEQLFPERVVSFRSYSLASFLVIRELFAEVTDFMTVNVIGGVTDLQLVLNDRVAHTTSFNKGIYYLSESIAHQLDRSAQEATTLLMAYVDGELEQGTRDMVRPIIEQATKEWVSEIGMYFDKALSNTSLPRSLFLTTHTRLYELFTRLLESELSSNYTISAQAFSVTQVNPALLRPQIVGAEQRTDTFILIDALYGNLALNGAFS